MLFDVCCCFVRLLLFVDGCWWLCFSYVVVVRCLLFVDCHSLLFNSLLLLLTVVIVGVVVGCCSLSLLVCRLLFVIVSDCCFVCCPFHVYCGLLVVRCCLWLCVVCL